MKKTCEICKNEFVHGYEDPVYCPMCEQEYEWDEDQQILFIVLSDCQKEILHRKNKIMIESTYKQSMTEGTNTKGDWYHGTGIEGRVLSFGKKITQLTIITEEGCSHNVVSSTPLDHFILPIEWNRAWKRYDYIISS